jgi:1-acyl-sn-glycerol-3-phosphate acyltransferase
VDWVPPKAARRLLYQPLVVLIGACALVVAVPVLLLTALVDLFLRRPFPTTRLAAVGLVHVIFEALGIISLFGLWLISAFRGGVRSPRSQELHHRFVRWWLTKLIGITGASIGIVVEIEDRRPPRSGPVLVFSRHAGPWDSFLLAHALVHDYRRHPRLVMKEAMQWFPTIDIVGNRLPNRFIRPRGTGAAAFIPQIEELAHGLGDHDALVIFPEGGNFTQRRRLAAIERLVREGHQEHAEEARHLANLIAPRPGGVMAAMRGAPDADVVFVAHTGLEPLASLPELWRRVPLRHPLLGRYWRMPASDVPSGEQAKVDWLFAWWERIDTWIDEHGTPTGARSRSP